jgi:hypothetical protein
MKHHLGRAAFLARLLAALGLGACQRSRTGSMMGGMMSSMSRGDTMRGKRAMILSRRGRGEFSQMMGSADSQDMQVYMQMFTHHQEIHRSVQRLKNGVRTVTESTNPHIVALLQGHVSKMYDHVDHGQEVRCMSDSLPTMFRYASRYRRQLQLTPHGVAIEETSDDPEVLSAIRRHADEVTGFVREGMPAMMQGMMP